MELQEDYAYEEEDGSVEGTYVKEFRISLSKEKIAALIDKYGTQRSDYETIFTGKVVKPVLTLKKKNAAIVVSWKEVINAEKYIVYRSEKKTGKYTKVAALKRDSEGVLKNSYTDKKVKYGKTYYYKVKAVGENESLTSEVVKFKVAPAKVKNVKVSSVKSTSVKISYDKLSETGYVIERSTDNKKWTVVKTITKNSTLSFKNTGLKANKTYYFRVRAYKSVSGKKVYGKYSDVVSVRTAPSAPKFTIANDTFQSLKLSITGVKGASKYIIYRSNSKKGTYKKIAETSEKNYYDYDLTLGRTYYYKVKSCNSDNKCSDNPSVVSKKVSLVKPKITLETGKTIPMTINFKNINMVDGIEIYRSTKKNGTYKRIKTVDSFSKKYIDETTKTKTTYYYKVRTFVVINGKKNYSAYSDIKSLTSLYVEPKIEKIAAKNASDFNGVYKKGDLTLKIYAKSDEQVDVRLTSEASFAGYVLEFKTDELYADSFGSKYKIVLVDGGVYFKSSESSETGEYSKIEEYGLDDYFADVLGTTSFMDTKYNGYFESSEGDKLYLFQNQEDTVMMDAQMEESYVGDTLNINETNATGEIFESSYELEVNDGVATLKVYEDGTLEYTKTFTRVSDLTKKEIVDVFAL
jgi:fibronectin type 3 domain-containing protein